MILEQRSHAAYLATTKAALEQELAVVRAEADKIAQSLPNQDLAILDLGDPSRLEPISPYWGVERGQPINRYYIEKFLQRHKADIRGRVLEMKDSWYARRFGGDAVSRSDVLDIDPLNPLATIVADLTRADTIPSDLFECFIFTQTLNFIYDVRAALTHAFRILKPGGVLLATVSSLDRISYETGPDGDYWRFTEGSLRALLAEHLPLDAFEIAGFGNVAACTAYLYGLSSQEIGPKTLDVIDPWFPIGFSIRAVKPAKTVSTNRTRQPLVSIVTAFFNSETFLEDAIESVLSQTYSNWELLLIDDGSRDRSTSIARQYARRYPGKMFYMEHENHENRGAAASRNRGIRQSAGEYVAILDADDVWLPHKLEQQVAILDAEPRAAMVCGRSLYWHSWTGKREDLQRDKAPDLGAPPDRLYEPPELLNLLYPIGKGGAPCPSDILLRRSMMELDGGFQEDFRGDYQLYEDQAFLTKLYLKHPIFVSSQLWDKYRIHPYSCVSTVTAARKNHSVRQFFLSWFEGYLLERGMEETPVWTALQNAILRYRPSVSVPLGEPVPLSSIVGDERIGRESEIINGDENNTVSADLPEVAVRPEHRPGSKVLVLAYHRIADESCDPWGLCVTPRHFDEHLSILTKSARVIPIRQLAAYLTEGVISERSVAITFDDGYADNFHAARPILERYELPAAFFVVSNYIGSQMEFWWDELDRLLLQPGTLPDSLDLEINGISIRARLGEVASYSSDSYALNRNWRACENPPTPRHSLYYSLWKQMRPMSDPERQRILTTVRHWANTDSQARKTHRILSRSELSALSKDRLIEVGCHTMTHPQLASLPPSIQSDEIRGCKQYLEEILGRAVTCFAYPYGGKDDFTSDTISLLREMGFSSACSTIPGHVTVASDPFQLPRMLVGNWNGEEFQRRLSEWFGEP